MYSRKSPHVRVTTNGVGFTGLLALLFIGLRLGEVIDWNWWLVLAPLWLPAVLSAALFLLVVVGIITAHALVALAARRKARKAPK